MGNRPLRLLLVEDAEDDVMLIVRALWQSGLDCTCVRVQTAEEFTAALVPAPDVVISDHSLPAFSSTAALVALRERHLDVPFIVVSGTLDEESAVGLLRAGAHDFVTKQNLARLGPAVRRELQEAKHRAERREAQTQLQHQRDFFRLVIDSNPAVIFAKDSQGRYTLVNRATAEILGTTPEALVGKTDHEVNPNAADVEQFLETDRAVMTNGHPVFVARESMTDLQTGRLRWFETRKVPLIVPEGPPQLLGIGIEITERVAAEDALRLSEEQLRQAQKMEAVGQLAGGIAHDFNNLLTAIVGYSDLLLHQLQNQPDVAQDLHQIRQAGYRAGSLTRQLLAFSRKQVLQPEVLDLGRVVEDVTKMLRRLIREDIQLQTRTASNLLPVLADPGQIEQVLINLVVNARDAMPMGGHLRIELANTAAPPALQGAGPSEERMCVTLSVADTGHGMMPDIQKRIFEPFFSTKGPGKGTGLGLAMVHGVVAQSGGCITVESEPGLGTRFTILLPAAAADQKPATQTPSVLTDLQGTETILLVEDDQAIRELVRKVLSGLGYHILDATDPVSAICIAERHHGIIDLLLSDIVMPNMSGPELAQHIVGRRPEVRVMYMSGCGNRLATNLGTVSDAVTMLHKPFTPDGLASKVRESFHHRRRATARR